VAQPHPTLPTTRAWGVPWRAPPASAARGGAGRMAPGVSGQAPPCHAWAALLACVSRVLTDVQTPS
jgi:hypothetical protein